MYYIFKCDLTCCKNKMQSSWNYIYHTCTTNGKQWVLPARAPDTVPFPWQLSTRTRLTPAPRATPESDPLKTPAMCVPWLSHWLACRGETCEHFAIEPQWQICASFWINVRYLSMNSDSVLLRDVVEVCDENSSFNLSVRTLNAAIHQIHLRLPSIICAGQRVCGSDINYFRCVCVCGVCVTGTDSLGGLYVPFSEMPPWGCSNLCRFQGALWAKMDESSST